MIRRTIILHPVVDGTDTYTDTAAIGRQSSLAV